MPDRQYSAATGYRYGFNGKEKDTESPVQYDYGFRIYDPRLVRFKSVDPLSKNHPSWSPYPFAMNRPIDGIDLDGLEYLKANESKIDIYVSYLEFNGRKVIYGSVHLDMNNVSANTQNYVNNSPWKNGAIGSGRSKIATFEHIDYNDILAKKQEAFNVLFKQADATDMEAKSLVQPNLEVPRIPKNKLEERQIQKSKQFTLPSGGGSSAKGNAIVAAVQLVGEVLQYWHGKKVDNDYNTANSQLASGQFALNDLQFALDNNLIPSQYLGNVSEFANYLLDGKKPTITYYIKNDKGENVPKESVNNNLIKAFNEIKSNISKERAKLSEPKQCVPCEE